jgi:NADH-quinone oxidoreductase subunit M
MLLAWLILIPLIGGLLCWQSDRFGNLPPRWIALASMSLVMYLSLDLWASGNYSLATDVLAAPSGRWNCRSPGFLPWASASTWHWTVCRSR